eukprot:gnl/Ergobibamus_cyprinoides/3928.p2 GENE.gnl/Ergobibamus_cyprinoides/3928~~gnl/Ergobibamus_cyprinoides/3928.p2  ORF type:complete len:105 (+),score=18.02 gnl/Ergobibamus_cyprinoides/3928:601-915(+)
MCDSSDRPAPRALRGCPVQVLHAVSQWHRLLADGALLVEVIAGPPGLPHPAAAKGPLSAVLCSLSFNNQPFRVFLKDPNPADEQSFSALQRYLRSVPAATPGHQ